MKEQKISGVQLKASTKSRNMNWKRKGGWKLYLNYLDLSNS